MRNVLPLALVLLSCTPGCGDKKETHLERFLDTTQAQVEAKRDAIDPFSVVEDSKVADRINQLGFSEVEPRLGPHRFRAKVSFELEGAESRVALREDDLIVLAQNGDFRVKVENDADQGYEVVFSGGRFFMREKYVPFHERPALGGDHIRFRDAAYGGWAAIYRLFRGRLTFTKQDMTRYNGRDGIRFGIGLAAAEPRLPGTVDPPIVPKGVTRYVYPIQPTPSATDRWRDKAKPLQASGTLVLDADCGVVLSVNLTGKLQLPPKEGSKEAITLAVSAKIETDGFGNPPSIPPPGKEEIKPVPTLIEVDTRPIDFYFGKGFTATLGPPAGVASAKNKTAQPDNKPNPEPGGIPSNP